MFYDLENKKFKTLVYFLSLLIKLEVSNQILEKRKENWKRPKEDAEGVLRKYSKMVGSASQGAVTD